MAQFIRSDGSAEEVFPADGESFTLEELQGFVGGFIEMISLEDGCVMFIDEEGKLKGKPENPVATLVVRGVIAPWDEIVGDAIICTQKEAGEEEFDAELDYDPIQVQPDGTIGD